MNEKYLTIFFGVILLGMLLSCFFLFPYLNRKRFKIIKNNLSIQDSSYNINTLAESIDELNHKNLKGLCIQDYAIIKIRDTVFPLCSGTAYYNSFDWRQGIRFDSSPEDRRIETLGYMKGVLEYVCTKGNIQIFWVRNLKKIVEHLKNI